MARLRELFGGEIKFFREAAKLTRSQANTTRRRPFLPGTTLSQGTVVSFLAFVIFCEFPVSPFYLCAAPQRFA
jgi:hypothetical protein